MFLHLLIFFITVTVLIPLEATTLQQAVDPYLKAIQNTASTYKYSLSLGLSGAATLTTSAFMMYKKNATQQKIPWSCKDFFKKYPALLKQAISFRSKKFHQEHPYFCTAVKLYAVTTAGVAWYEYNNAQKTAELERIKNFNNIRINQSLTPRISERAAQPAWVTNPLPVDRKVTPYDKIAIQDFDTTRGEVPVPSATAPQLLAERKQEETDMQNQSGTVLIERNLCCLYCHTPFNDDEVAYFYGQIPDTQLPSIATATCPPTHLYHQGCINSWENSLNNGYAGDPKGCHYKCFASNAEPKDKEARADLHSVHIKLRQHDNPNYAPLEPVIDGVITNPHDENGIPVTECASCKKSFKNNETVAFANLHPQCGTNHLYHPACFEYFRTTCDAHDPRARGGECWKVRGISCPAHCVDYHYDEKGEAHDQEPCLAKIKFTDAIAREQINKPAQTQEPLINIKNAQKLPAGKKMQCQGCGKTTENCKNRYWTEFKCASPECQNEEPLQYCYDIQEENEQKQCLKPRAGCSICLKLFPDTVFKEAVWYKN